MKDEKQLKDSFSSLWYNLNIKGCDKMDGILLVNKEAGLLQEM